MSDELEENDIPDLSDEELERVVAEWLGWSWRWVDDGETSRLWTHPDGPRVTSCRPNYTSDPAAAWRLQKRMPAELVWQYDKTCLKVNPYSKSGSPFWIESSQGMERILSAAAGILAVRSVEPREVGDE